MAVRLARESGFTLVEVMVAAAVMLTGGLATLALLDTASDRTAAASAREGATNLARELVEAAREVPFSQVSRATIAERLRERPALAGELAAGRWIVQRRGIRYEVAVDACSIDDVADGTGAHSKAFCASGPAAGTADRRPEDHKRIVVRVAWTQDGLRRETSQTTLLTRGDRGTAPDVTSLEMTAPQSSPIADPATAAASFAVTTSAPAASVQWAIDDAPRGLAAGSGSSFSFSWSLPLVDGAYQVSARGFDASGASGAVRSLTVVVNRHAPEPPGFFNAGLNGTSLVEAEWQPARDRDVLGHRVYRSLNGGEPELACALTELLWCIDSEAPPGGTLVYWAVAIDRDADGAEREGAPSPEKAIDRSNKAPPAPTGLKATANEDGTTTLTWNVSRGDPDRDDYIESFRIYRDGTTIAHRYDRTADGTATSWTDTASGGTRHDYYVRSVDTHLRESAIAGPASG